MMMKYVFISPLIHPGQWMHHAYSYLRIRRVYMHAVFLFLVGFFGVNDDVRVPVRGQGIQDAMVMI